MHTIRKGFSKEKLKFFWNISLAWNLWQIMVCSTKFLPRISNCLFQEDFHGSQYQDKWQSFQELMILTGKNLCFTEFSTKIYWNTRLVASDVFHMFIQLSSFSSIIIPMSENVIHQIESKNEWLLISVTFTAQFELVFVLTLENSFS